MLSFGLVGVVAERGEAASRRSATIQPTAAKSKKKGAVAATTTRRGYSASASRSRRARLARARAAARARQWNEVAQPRERRSQTS